MRRAELPVAPISKVGYIRRLGGLTYFDDFFELSGNWPEWLKLFATGA